MLLQFGKTDEFVTEAEAQAQLEAANEPKQIMWSLAGHGLNEKARRDRVQSLQTLLTAAPTQ